MKYAWTLHRSDRPAELGIGTLQEIEAQLSKLDLHGLMPLAWILTDMQQDEDVEGKASHHHDAPAPDEWQLTWSKIA